VRAAQNAPPQFLSVVELNLLALCNRAEVRAQSAARRDDAVVVVVAQTVAVSDSEK
jgi:hypothetical protein